MLTRLNAFNALSDHPWLGRVYKRLTIDELNFAKSFIESHFNTPKGEFEFAVNRMFIGQSKPKHWREISELLTCANSALQ